MTLPLHYRLVSSGVFPYFVFSLLSLYRVSFDIAFGLSKQNSTCMDFSPWPMGIRSPRHKFFACPTVGVGILYFVDKFACGFGNGELNALFTNARLFPGDYTQTQDGWEVTYLQSFVFPVQNTFGFHHIRLQVNYLSYALLIILFLPYLIESSSPDSPSCLVLVSSLGHYFVSKLKDSRNSILGTINHFGHSFKTTRGHVYSGARFVRVFLKPYKSLPA
ncbi:hypothetical protein HD554DRAFT_1059683 [Boletus coccyginus]|nr:hypothetical protein HD554DRAFT_1059683 [Boletus coccyginus]